MYKSLEKYLLTAVLSFTIALSGQTPQGQENGTPTQDEYEAAIGCDSCFDEIDLLDRQKENYKVQVKAKGITVNSLKTIVANMEELVEYWKAKANEKPKLKDVGFWPKLWLFLKGAVVGGLVTFGFIVVQGI